MRKWVWIWGYGFHLRGIEEEKRIEFLEIGDCECENGRLALRERVSFVSYVSQLPEGEERDVYVLLFLATKYFPTIIVIFE